MFSAGLLVGVIEVRTVGSTYTRGIAAGATNGRSSYEGQA